MKECLTEFEELQEALKKVDMDYEVMPFVRGRLCESESYNKIKKILATPELIKSHRWCLNLDPEQLSEDEIDKVAKIYDLGIKRGFIEEPEDDDDEIEVAGDVQLNVPQVEDPEVEPDEAPFAYKSNFKAKVPCWTILYSATKGGEIKSGQCYSNAIDVRAAKADCYAKLSRFGYENISILAIEAGDPDECDCCNDDACKCADDKKEQILTGVEEDDLIKGREHNLHVNEEAIEEDTEELDESGNPYTAGMKTTDIGGVSSISAKSSKPAKKAAKKSTKKPIKEDDEEEKSEEKDTKEEKNDDSSSEDDTSTDDSEEKNDSEETSSDDSSSEDSDETSDDTEDTSDDSEENTSDEDTSDSSEDEAEDDDEDSSEEADDSGDETSDDEKSDDAEDDSEGNSDEESDDESDDDNSDSDEDGDEDSESSDDEVKDDLSDEDKAAMKNDYKKAFRAAIEKCKFYDKCFDDLTISEKVDFFTTLSKSWKKNDPKDFMDDKEIEQLNKITIKK